MSVIRQIRAFIQGAPVVFFHEFHRPPYGGGNQFLMALKKQLEATGLIVGVNRVGHPTKACLINSYNFDFKAVYRAKMNFQKIRWVHRIDGPIGVYRSRDDGTDRRIWDINQELGAVTVFQSNYSLKKHLELGYTFRDARVIHNAVDPSIFYSSPRKPLPDQKDKIKLVATSWSDNVNKGAETYRWLEQNLDWSRYEFTFVGRCKIPFKRIRHLPPCSSEKVAALLREHDIYMMASQHESCSNALLEALACGLPAVYVNSGSNPELVGSAGVAYETPEQALVGLDTVGRNMAYYQSKISVVSLDAVCRQYGSLMLNEHSDFTSFS